MNKTKKGALGAAGVGVVALAMFGGGTFAFWSDFDTIKDNNMGAGKLQLNVHDSALWSIEPGNLAPGENEFRDVYVASNDGDSVPDGQLSVTLQNLVDTEDGCTNTNGEAAVDDCKTNSVGDLSTQAVVDVVSYAPGPGGTCGLGTLKDETTISTGQTLAEIKDQEFLVDTLVPGEGVCVRVLMSLPEDATNAVQGDSTEFDAYFELEQVS